ncbi:MAG: hypothetical protein ACON30_01560 [Flavobacteriaceae bacterium]
MKNLLIYSFIFLFGSICFGQSDFKDLDNKNTGLVSILQFSLAKNYEAHQVVNIPNTGSRGTDLSVSKSFAKSLNVVLGYFVIPHRLMLGVGFGLDRYENPGFNTAPLYGDVRFYWTDERNVPYLNVSLGGLLKLSSDFKPGATARLSLGYKFFISEKLAFHTDFGYFVKGVYLDGKSRKESNNDLSIRGVALTIGVNLF